MKQLRFIAQPLRLKAVLVLLKLWTEFEKTGQVNVTGRPDEIPVPIVPFFFFQPGLTSIILQIFSLLLLYF